MPPGASPPATRYRSGDSSRHVEQDRQFFVILFRALRAQRDSGLGRVLESSVSSPSAVPLPLPTTTNLSLFFDIM